MPATDLQSTLARAEQAADAVSEALMQGAPERAEAAARQLQQSATDLTHLLGLSPGMRRSPSAAAPLAPEVRSKLAHIARVIAMQREACIRRNGVVERSLQALVPATRTTTYAGAAAGAYARSGKQSGAFKLLSA